MSGIEHWTVTACQNCGLPFGIHIDYPKDRDGIHIAGGAVEVVPAAQLTGAVGALREAREFVASTIGEWGIDEGDARVVLTRIDAAIEGQ